MTKLRVLLTTEGTYPFHHGGVSVWCDLLAKGLKQVDFAVLSIIMNPFVAQKFELPSNARLYKVPLWGTDEPCEHLEKPFTQVYLAKKITSETIIKERFLPLFHKLLAEIVSQEKDPAQFGLLLAGFYDYFSIYEYKETFKSSIIWETYKQQMWEYSNQRQYRLAAPNVYALLQSLGWLYRFLNIVNTPIPSVDVTHSAAAAFCGLPCVLAKIKLNTPYLLTEHGVYLREQYLSLGNRKYSSFLSSFLMRFINSVTAVNYHYADQVSPVCSFNIRWEKRLGVSEERIKVIYNGVDKDFFQPRKAVPQNYISVISTARIDPIKDIVTLLQAVSIVLQKRRDIRFTLYGSVSSPEYYQQCLQLCQELKLNDYVVFAGHSNDMPKVYNSADFVVVSSVSEAFPYSVVEAMLCGKPVIATDVGGIKEAIGETGRLITPRHHEELAAAILEFAADLNMCRQLGAEARERALSLFALEKVLSSHLKTYLKLILTQFDKPVQKLVAPNLHLYLKRAEALERFGYYRKAIDQYSIAMKVAPKAAAAIYICGRISFLYNKLNESRSAQFMKIKAKLLRRFHSGVSASIK